MLFFYPCFEQYRPIRERRYKCNIFTHWLRPFYLIWVSRWKKQTLPDILSGKDFFLVLLHEKAFWNKITKKYLFFQDRGIDDTIFQNPLKLHLTVGTLTLMTEAEVDQATQLLNECHQNIIKLVSTLRLEQNAAILQTTFSNIFSWKKKYVVCFKFHLRLSLRIQLTIIH